ncbi:hypothetical protein JCM30237_28700 [Halolamina litorea]|uniref:DUF4382 domain-containing protein n=1 Tax=Halolamina litorea TaxID=1515593 RepID=A0ABD6BSQ7_9EURY|nr:DUF4382 domain-containing protein [Halolamina litorea]
MSDTTTTRRNYLRAAGAVGLAGITGLAGCSGGTATGTLATVVKDAPGDIADFERCVVTVEGFWLAEGGEGGDDGGDGDDGGENTATTDEDAVTTQNEEDVDQSDDRTYYEYDEPQEADLVQLQDGETKLVDEHEIETGTYAYLQLDVSGVDATLTGGDSAEVVTPGEAPLQFNESFEVRADQRTTFTADFTPVQRGGSNGYILQPVASGTEVSYEATETETDAE